MDNGDGDKKQRPSPAVERYLRHGYDVVKAGLPTELLHFRHDVELGDCAGFSAIHRRYWVTRYAIPTMLGWQVVVECVNVNIPL